MELFIVSSLNQINGDGIVCWHKQTVMMQRSVRAPRSNEGVDDVHVAAESPDWSVRQSPSSLHALTERIALRYRAVEFESVSQLTDRL